MINSVLMVDFLKLVEDYGVLITVLFVAILIAYMLITNSSKRIREQEQKIDSLYGRIDKLMNKFSSEENTELVGKFVNYAENATKIQIQLYHLLQNFGAERDRKSTRLNSSH